MSCAVEWFV